MTDQPCERHRFGWCCDYDYDNGTYRTTTECIGRTRDADAVEAARPLTVERLARALHAIASDGVTTDSSWRKCRIKESHAEQAEAILRALEADRG